MLRRLRAPHCESTRLSAAETGPEATGLENFEPNYSWGTLLNADAAMAACKQGTLRLTAIAAMATF